MPFRAAMITSLPPAGISIYVMKVTQPAGGAESYVSVTSRQSGNANKIFLGDFGPCLRGMVARESASRANPIITCRLLSKRLCNALRSTLRVSAERFHNGADAGHEGKHSPWIAQERLPFSESMRLEAEAEDAKGE